MLLAVVLLIIVEIMLNGHGGKMGQSAVSVAVKSRIICSSSGSSSHGITSNSNNSCINNILVTFFFISFRSYGKMSRC